MSDIVENNVETANKKKTSKFKSRFILAKEYRKRAEKICKSMYKDFAIAYIIFIAIFVIIATFAFIPRVGPIIMCALFLTVAGPCAYSQLFMNKQAKEGIAPAPGDAFFGFAHFARTFIVTFLHALVVIIGLVLLIVPGIYFYCNYSMSEIISLENDEMSSIASLKQSHSIMRGHRRNYFCLILSYIGWILLSILTIGILFLWVWPKINAAKYEFYLDITKKEANNK